MEVNWKELDFNEREGKGKGVKREYYIRLIIASFQILNIM